MARSRVASVSCHRRVLRVLPLLTFLCVPIAAQDPDVPPALQTLMMAIAVDSASPVQVDGRMCARLSGQDAALCRGLVGIRLAQRDSDGTRARAVRDTAEREIATTQGQSSAWWFLLGEARLILVRTGVLAREGPLQPTGSSNLLGANNALVHALEMDPRFAAAANALALAPLPRESADYYRNRVTTLRRVRAMLSGPALAAAARAEREAGSLDSAIALQRRALSIGGVDTGVVLLDLAQSLYQHGEPVAGRTALLSGAGVASEAAHRAYRQGLSWVATNTELAIWDTLSPGSRQLFVAIFWARRDIAEGRGDGERLVEHYRRVSFALSHFRLMLPQTGRQIVLTMPAHPVDLGKEYAARERAWKAPPIIAQPQVTLNPPLVRSAKAVLKDSDDPEALGRFVRDSKSIGSESPFRYYRPIQDLVDDRGVIWVRHGEPTQRAATVGGDAIEVWRYEFPGTSLVFQFRDVDFDGVAGASVLVPTLITLPAPDLVQVCHLERSLCPLSNRVVDEGDPGVLNHELRVEGERRSTDAITRARDKGRAQIDTGTATDSYHRDFTREVTPTLQILGLDRATGGSPRLVVAFAIPGGQLASVSANGRTVYPVHFQLMALDFRNGHRTGLDTLRQFVTNAALVEGQFIMGALELPVPEGTYTVSLVITQEDGRGAVAHLGKVTAPRASTRLAVSDLVLGREGSGVRWNSGATVVPLNPLNAYPKGGAAEVYFQLSGLTSGATCQTAFEFYKSDDDPKRPPRLRIAAPLTAGATRLEVQRTLGLQNLEPGRYRVQLTVSGAGETVKAVGWMTVVK